MQNPHITPWPCPKCIPTVTSAWLGPDGYQTTEPHDPPEWIYDDQDKRIGWICHKCGTGEDYTEVSFEAIFSDHKQPRPRTHWRNIDDQDEPNQEPDSGIL